jgi:membrane-associated protease RseP (regulator of RpoE activity)
MGELSLALVGSGWWYWNLPYGPRVLFVVFVATWVAVLLHELAHALMARALGVRVWSISLGRGPVLWQGVVRGCHVRLALLPLHGEVRLHDLDAEQLGYRDVRTQAWRFVWRAGSSWRAPIISAAGTLANLLAAKAVVAYWAAAPGIEPPARMLSLSLFLVNAFMLLNLMPLRGFDGWRVAVHAAAWRQSLATAGNS